MTSNSGASMPIRDSGPGDFVTATGSCYPDWPICNSRSTAEKKLS